MYDNLFSNNLETKNETKKDDSNIPENLKTGSFLSNGLILIAISLIITIGFLTKKKNKLYKI